MAIRRDQALYFSNIGKKIDESDSINDGLLAWWTFDNNSIAGTSVADQSPNGYVGTLAGAPTISTGLLQSGQSLVTNGTTGMKMTTTLVMPTTNFTVAMWVNSSSTGSNNRLFGNGNTGTGADGTGVIWGQAAGQIYIVARPAGNEGSHDLAVSPAGGISGTHHFAYSIGPEGLRMFWDGVSVGLNAITTNIVSNLTVAVGGESVQGSGGFNGSIDDTRIWKRVLSAAEIARIYADQSGGLGAKRRSTYFSPLSLTVISGVSATAGIGTLSTDVFRGGFSRPYASKIVVQVPSIPVPDLNDSINQGLALAWGLGEGAGSTVIDWSGRGANGTISTFSPSQWVSGKYGKALAFTGSQTVSKTVSAINSLPKTTISFRIKGNVNSAPQFGRIIEKGANQDWCIGVNVGANDNSLFFQPGGGSGTGTGAVILDGTWKHVVVSFAWSGTLATVNCYVNGINKYSNTISSGLTTSGTNPINLAQYSASIGTYVFGGSLADVRIWSRILTGAEVMRLYSEPMAGVKIGLIPHSGSSLSYAPISISGLPINSGIGTLSTDMYNPANIARPFSSRAFLLRPELPSSILQNDPINNGLIGAWSLSEGAGTKFMDWSGHGRNVSLTGGSASWAQSPTGHTLNLDGSTQSTATSASISAPAAITVTQWIYMNDTHNYAPLVNQWDESTTRRSWGMFIFSGGSLNLYNSSDGNNNVSINTGATVLTTGKWYFLTGVIAAGGTAKIYINGIQISTGALNATTFSTAMPLYIGYSPQFGGSAGQKFNGRINNCRFFNRVLTQTEIMRLYSEPMAGMARTYATNSFQSKVQNEAANPFLTGVETDSGFAALTTVPFAISSMVGVAANVQVPNIPTDAYQRNLTFPPGNRKQLLLPTIPTPNSSDPINKGLVGAWAMSNTGSSTLYDWSGYGRNLVATGYAPSMWSRGKQGPAVLFNGTSQYFSNATWPWPANSAVTISQWVNTPGGNGNNNSLTIGNQSSGQLFVQIYLPFSDNVLYWDYGNQSTGRINTAYTSYLNKWTHVVVVSNGSTFKAIYINGVLITSGNTALTPNSPLTGIFVGDVPIFGSVFWKGTMFDLRVWNRVLQPSEIMRLYSEPQAGMTTPLFNKNSNGFLTNPSAFPTLTGNVANANPGVLTTTPFAISSLTSGVSASFNTGTQQIANGLILFAGQEDISFIIKQSTSNTGVSQDTTSTHIRGAYTRYGLLVDGNVNGSFSASNQAYIKTPFFTPNSMFYISARIYCTDGNGGLGGPSPSGQGLFQLLDANGIPRIRARITTNSTTAPLLFEKLNAAGVATTLGTATSVLNKNQATPDKIDIFINYAVSGSLTFYVNGVTFFTFSGDVTTDGQTLLSQLLLQSYYNGSVLQTAGTIWSEVIVSTAPTFYYSLQTQTALYPGNTDTWTTPANGTQAVNSGATSSTLSQGTRIYYEKIFNTVAGPLVSLAVNFSSGLTGTTQMALYTDAGGTSGPLTLLASSVSSVITNPTSGLQTYTVTGGPTLSPGVNYWVAFRSSASFVLLQNSATTANFGAFQAFATSFPSTASGLTIGNGWMWAQMNITGIPAPTHINATTNSITTPDVSTAGGQLEEYTVAQAPNTGTIVSVVQHGSVVVGPTGPTKIDFVVRTGGVDYSSLDMVGPTGWTTLIVSWDVNPNTLIPWVVTDLPATTAFNFGYKSVT